MSTRVCPHCGSDTWKSSSYDDLRAAHNRGLAMSRQQAVEILELKLRVAELEAREHGRSRKVNRQARVIRRLEEKLLAAGKLPHENVSPNDTEPVHQETPTREPGPDTDDLLLHPRRPR